MVSDQTYWDKWNSGTNSYTVEAVLDNECAYEEYGSFPVQNPSRGLKTGSSFYKNTSAGSPNWTLDHTESYSYDPQLDYLTGANYGDGLPNATPTWTYDAAGNRYNGTNNNPACAFDNLNRPNELLGHTCTSDILGNRLTCGSQSYGWDALNRMTSYGTTSSYVYRADGMRVSKAVGSTTTTYAYDGQMGMEDVDVTAGVSTITDYGLGARGVDYISSTKSGTTTVGFPIYDAHGNMTACLFRSGSSYYSLANQRHYDAWGAIRNGAISGDPKGRYCASLGHKQDDESGLVYMRARYYEPSSGRFLSEDPMRKGRDWFVYAADQPVTSTDPTGKFTLGDLMAGAGDEAAQALAEAQQGETTVSWAQNAIQRSRMEWAEQVGDEIVDLFGDDELGLESKAANRIQLIGVDGQYGIGVQVDNGNVIVKTYQWGDRLVGDVSVAIQQWWG